MSWYIQYGTRKILKCSVVKKVACADCCCCVASVVSDSVWPHRQHPTRLPHPWDSPGKNTGVGCHFLLQCMKVKSESEVAQSCPTLATPWTAAFQAPPSMGFSRQKYWSGVPFPSPMHESEKWTWSCSVMSDSAIPWTAAHQAPPSMGTLRRAQRWVFFFNLSLCLYLWLSLFFLLWTPIFFYLP